MFKFQICARQETTEECSNRIVNLGDTIRAIAGVADSILATKELLE